MIKQNKIKIILNGHDQASEQPLTVTELFHTLTGLFWPDIADRCPK